MQLINSNNLEALKSFSSNSIDSIVTDPPYGISFMGKKWDYDVPSVQTWKECLRVLKPGGHILVACGTRTQHRMAVNIEDAGFEIRDIVAWIYGSGFPKSLNIGKVADKYLKTGNASWNGTGDSSNGALGYSKLQHQQGYRPEDYSNKHQNKNEITENDAKKWEGWGTALKPAMELWTLARKPLSEKNVASNVLKWGTGGINIDGSRVGNEELVNRPAGNKPGGNSLNMSVTGMPKNAQETTANGRFPANVIHDGSDEVTDLFPNTKSQGHWSKTKTTGFGKFGNGESVYEGVGQKDKQGGSASRFFYCAKASKSERNAGLDGFEEKIMNLIENNARTWNDRCLTCKKKFVGSDETICHCPAELKITDKTIYKQKNNHPTVKPIALMSYLIKLITPTGGIVLDPFMGSGSTGVACQKEGFDFIGMELDEEYFKIAEARINNWTTT